MSLVVDNEMTSSPDRIPPAGGPTTVTFQALASPGPSRLQAIFETTPESAYVIVGSDSLGPVAVPSTFKSYSKSLILRPRADPAPATFVVIAAQVQEVDANDQPIGAPRPATGGVDVES